jgi:hypothetical protein
MSAHDLQASQNKKKKTGAALGRAFSMCPDILGEVGIPIAAVTSLFLAHLGVTHTRHLKKGVALALPSFVFIMTTLDGEGSNIGHSTTPHHSRLACTCA